jgi:hypothetical protein
MKSWTLHGLERHQVVHTKWVAYLLSERELYTTLYDDSATTSSKRQPTRGKAPKERQTTNSKRQARDFDS